MNRCLICYENIQETLNDNKICNKCIKNFKIIEKSFYIDRTEIFILYEYNDFFKEILYRFKGCYDYPLKDAFLNNYKYKLKRKYKNRTIICAPSFIKEDRKRGFNHVKEIFKSLDLEMIECLSKSTNHKQAITKYEERKKIQDIIKIDKSKIKGVKRVLIVDDVTTSLSTIKAIIRLLPTNIDIKVLILASNCRFMENEKN